MRARILLATAAVVAAGLSASAADAAAKACNLVKDPSGDVSNSFEGVDVFPADQGLDLVGADVASDSRNITAVIRLAAAPGEATVYAKRYIAQFRVAGLANPMVLAAAITPTGTVFSYGYYGTSQTTTSPSFIYSGTPAAGKIDGKVITVSTTLANAAAMDQLGVIKRNAKISGITVTANRRVPSLTQVTGQVIVADEALGRTSYYAGSPSCVKPYAG